MKALALLTAFAMPVLLYAQQPGDAASPQALYESGRYEQTLSAVAGQGGAPPPAAIYLAGLSRVRLGQPDLARAEFAKLGTPDPQHPEPWPLVGRSAIAVVDGDVQGAVDAARRAVAAAPDQFHPNFQLGLALSGAEQWAEAAATLDKAATIDPSFAYAHYNAGLAYSKVRRLDEMASHFEYFLRLAPQAPERPAVMTLMRAVRGQ